MRNGYGVVRKRHTPRTTLAAVRAYLTEDGVRDVTLIRFQRTEFIADGAAAVDWFDYTVRTRRVRSKKEGVSNG